MLLPLLRRNAPSALHRARTAQTCPKYSLISYNRIRETGGKLLLAANGVAFCPASSATLAAYVHRPFPRPGSICLKYQHHPRPLCSSTTSPYGDLVPMPFYPEYQCYALASAVSDTCPCAGSSSRAGLSLALVPSGRSFAPNRRSASLPASLYSAHSATSPNNPAPGSSTNENTRQVPVKNIPWCFRLAIIRSLYPASVKHGCATQYHSPRMLLTGWFMNLHKRTNVSTNDMKKALMMAHIIKCGQNWLLGPYQGTVLKVAGSEASAGAGVLIGDTVGINQSAQLGIVPERPLQPLFRCRKMCGRVVR